MISIASMGLQTTLQIVLAGICAIFGLAQPITTGKSAFSPQSIDELKSAVDTCLNDVNNMAYAINNDSKDFFTFVLIPANDDPLQEVEKLKAIGLKDDNVKKHVKSYFGYGHDRRVERTALDYPRSANSFTYVTMYSYDNAEAEKLPVNKRASAIASACMTVKTWVYGDAFLARYFDKVKSNNDGSKWINYDLFKSEVDQEAEWVLQAAKYKALAIANDNSEETFTFVFIPTGDNQLQEMKKPKTARPEDDEVKKYAQSYFGYTQDTLLNRTELDYPRPANNFTYVTMFSYRNAQAEKMPINTRASTIASACMTFDMKVYGDAFLARYWDKFHAEKAVSKWTSYDLFKSEVDVEAEWVQQAAKFNVVVRESLVKDDIEHNPDSKFNAKGKDGPVSWSQTEDDVEVIIAIPKGVKGRDVSVIIKYDSIKFALKNGHKMPEKSSEDKKRLITLLDQLLLGLELYQYIDPELSAWTLFEGQVVITLAKKKTGYWRELYAIGQAEPGSGKK